MLPKAYRLPAYLIPKILKKGKTISLPLFFLKYQPLKFLMTKSSALNAFSLFAFIVPQKLEKRARVRHQSKRRLAEAVRNLWSEVAPGYGIIILAKKEILKADYQAIFREIKKALESLKISDYK